MRGRIVWVMILTAVAIVACTRKHSLYIEPGKADAPAEQPARR